MFHSFKSKVVLDPFGRLSPHRRKWLNLKIWLSLKSRSSVDERVKSLLERRIFLRIDADKQPEISQRMNVEGLPDIRFITPEGKVVKQLRSYQDAESFAEELGRLLRSLGR